MPTGDYAITGFWGEVVDENNVSVPLSTVYTHHWIAVNDVHKNELCKNGPEYVFGIGAESRNNPIRFPSGYGHVVTGERYWGANLHLLHTQGLAGDPHKAAKECNECYYAPEKGDECTCIVLEHNDDQEEYSNSNQHRHTSDIANALGEYADFVWYENPKMSIPEIFHVQVFAKRRGF